MRIDPATKILCQIAFGGGVITVGLGLLAQRRVRRRYESMAVYKEAVDLLKENRHIKNYLGEPIQVRGIDFTHKFTAEDDRVYKLAVNANGKLSGGILYLEARKSEENPEEASVSSMEFELDNPRGRLKLM